MPRQEYTYHFIYKITCTLNGKYYIGMHSTFDLEDGYMGSGKRIKRSIEKHGIKNHTKEILEFLPNRSSLKEREKELVNEKLIKDSLCMNLKLGGEGGFDHIPKEVKSNNLKKVLNKLWQDENYRDSISKRSSKQMKKRHKEGLVKIPNWNGRKHSEETKDKLKKSLAGKQVGSKNSQFGKIWITNGKENKKIPKGDKIPKGFKLGRKIKLVMTSKVSLPAETQIRS